MQRRSHQRRWWLTAAFAVGLATIGVVTSWRGFPWLMAVSSGVGVGALVYLTLHTSSRIRSQFRRDG
ncbi:MAG TPA: hypothetical protein VNB06_23370 [Thermoanaerobaculia bacterium]|nr:hypothetical protein [Thermoanaerobaculia bacterium]